MQSACPCKSGKSYGDCCGRYIDAGVPAPTAEALMRSRYSAFALRNVDYVLKTHLGFDDTPATREAVDKDLHATEWTNLIVRNSRRGGPADKEGEVTFVAACRPRVAGLGDNTSAPISQLHERSQFVKKDGLWFYTEGEHLPPFAPARNDLCWCGSGKKFKKCHG